MNTGDIKQKYLVLENIVQRIAFAANQPDS